MDGLIVTALKQIHHPKGDIFHVLKKSEESFDSFGEVYFSNIKKDLIKGWKKHKSMTMNLVVPVGAIRFVFCDRRETSTTKGEFFSTIISPENYCRITVPPNVWTAFQGLREHNLLLNIANMEHDPLEAENIDLENIAYDW